MNSGGTSATKPVQRELGNTQWPMRGEYFPTIARDVPGMAGPVVLCRAHPHTGRQHADRRQADAALRRHFRPFVALYAAAAVTSRIKLGTGVCLVTERDPITLAKEVASLDRLSGRALGVGAVFGVPPDKALLG
jgi:alkanesulfonate monooxygenase SsuD/methylene tetrahydromethanopterin reductase-like flavin-dependent oxidoreductase (luciferase family)